MNDWQGSERFCNAFRWSHEQAELGDFNYHCEIEFFLDRPDWLAGGLLYRTPMRPVGSAACMAMPQWVLFDGVRLLLYRSCVGSLLAENTNSLLRRSRGAECARGSFRLRNLLFRSDWAHSGPSGRACDRTQPHQASMTQGDVKSTTYNLY